MTDQVPFPGDSRPLHYRVYLPPCFDPARATRYPTLYLLHGLTSDDSQWISLGLADVADSLITSGLVPPFLVIMPWEQTGFDMEVALLDGLLPKVEQVYPAGGSRELRAIGGLSHGGGWALRIGAKHPDLFGAIGLHSPAVLNSDLFSLASWLQAQPTGTQLRLWIDIGTQDSLRPMASKLRDILDDGRVPYTWVLDTGDHMASYWSSHLRAYLHWYAQEWPLPPD